MDPQPRMLNVVLQQPCETGEYLGEYLNETSKKCFPCKLCLNMKVLSECKDNLNRECGNCLPGFVQGQPGVDSCIECGKSSLGCEVTTNLTEYIFKNHTTGIIVDPPSVEVLITPEPKNPDNAIILCGVFLSLLLALLILIVLLVQLRKKRQRANHTLPDENRERENEDHPVVDHEPNARTSCIEVINEHTGKVVYRRQSLPVCQDVPTRSTRTRSSSSPSIVRRASCSSIQFCPSSIENQGATDHSTIFQCHQQEISQSDSNDKEKAMSSIFQYVAKRLTYKDWKMLGRKLGLEESHLSTILFDYAGDLEEQKYQMLLKWQAISAESQVTIENLVLTLGRVDLQNLADQVKKKIQQSNQGANDNQSDKLSPSHHQQILPYSESGDDDNEEFDETRPLLGGANPRCKPPLLMRSFSAPARTLSK